MESSIPQAYLLSRTASPEEIERAKAALSITPLYFVVISNMQDAPLAAQFEVEVLKARNEHDAIEIALFTFAQQAMPSLVIVESPDSGLLIAIQEDGSRKEVI